MRTQARQSVSQIVVLAWAESAYDLSQLTRVLGQACHAFSKQDGCNAVVVLTQVWPAASSTLALICAAILHVEEEHFL